MTGTLRARATGLLVFLLIAALVIGGLGWVTAATLRLELSDQMRLGAFGDWRAAFRRPLLARIPAPSNSIRRSMCPCRRWNGI